MFVCYDEKLRINAYNEENDLSGNTGWGYTNDSISEPLTEEHGVAIYKYVNGNVMNRTQEEIDADIAEIPLVIENATIDDYQNAIERLGVEL